MMQQHTPGRCHCNLWYQSHIFSQSVKWERVSNASRTSPLDKQSIQNICAFHTCWVLSNIYHFPMFLYVAYTYLDVLVGHIASSSFWEVESSRTYSVSYSSIQFLARSSNNFHFKLNLQNILLSLLLNILYNVIWLNLYRIANINLLLVNSLYSLPFAFTQVCVLSNI